jgi:hypothetical protein
VVEKTFESEFPNWVQSACKDWDYRIPGAEYYRKVYERLPKGIRNLLSQGLRDGLIITDGRMFTLRGLGLKKGPYNWLSRYASAKEPAPNWEYFVQVAEFVRLQPIASSKGLSVNFEDDLMDIAIYRDGKLVICCEVKERARQIQRLVNGIMKYQSSVDFAAKDRGNDPLRKAKYIVKRHPDYFVGVAIGKRLEYSVRYPKGKAFQLNEDMIPWL